MKNKSIRKDIRSEKDNLIILSVYTFLLLFFCSMMSPLYPLNEWSDVNLYFNIGKAMFEGRTLYTEAFDHKGPMIFLIYGIGYLISHGSFLGMFIIQIILWCVMSLAIYFTAKLFLDKSYSLLVALLFPLFFLKYSQEGGSAEEFILIFESVSLYFFIRYFKDKETAWHDPRFMLIHGIMCSMALFIKINLVVFWIFPVLGIFINLIVSKQYRNILLNLVSFIGGILIIVVPFIVYFYWNGALEKAYDIYIVLNSKYASIPETFGETIKLILYRIYKFLRGDILSSLVIFSGIFYFPIKYIGNKTGKISFMLTGISVFVIISFTRSFFTYYNLPFYIFNILGWISVFLFFKDYVKISYSRKLFLIFTLIFLCLGINTKSFFRVGPGEFFERTRSDYVISRFSDIIGKEKNPTLVNLGFGGGNAVFTVCNIIPDITYFVTPNIPYYLYPELRDEQTSYLKDKRTQFVILTNFSLDYNYFVELPELKQNYTLIDTFIDNRIVDKTEFYTYYLYKRND